MVGSPVPCVPGRTSPRDPHETEGSAFAERRRNRVAVYAVSLKVVERNGKLAVVLAAVAEMFDLDAVENAVP